MKIRRIAGGILFTLLVIAFAAGCGGKDGAAGKSAGTPGQAAAEPGKILPAAPVKINFWHSMTGATGELIKTIVADYNNTWGKEHNITVEAIFQGAYDDASTKLAAILQSNSQSDLPDIMQMSSKGIFEVKESEYIYPVQKLVDMDPNGINIKDLNAPALHYAMYKDYILGLPFSNSSIMLFYNKDLFRKAGLDPEKPPKTIAELADYTAKLTKRSGNKIETFGFATKLRFFLLGTWIPMQGQNKNIFNNANGRGGTPTEISMTKDGSLDTLLTEWSKVLATGGVAYNEMSPAEGFQNGMYAMCALSTSSMATVYRNIQTPGLFQVGVAEFPRVNTASTSGTGIGGSAVYVFDTGSQDKLLGAWDFLKFLASPESSAKWFMNTGYYGMNDRCYELPETKAFLDKQPLFNIILEIEKRSSEYPDYLEPWVPSFTDIDTTIQNELILFGDGKQDKAATIKNIDTKVNRMLKDYWDANP